MSSGERALNIEPAHLRHVKVEHDAVRFVVLHRAQELRARRKRLDGETRGRKSRVNATRTSASSSTTASSGARVAIVIPPYQALAADPTGPWSRYRARRRRTNGAGPRQGDRPPARGAQRRSAAPTSPASGRRRRASLGRSASFTRSATTRTPILRIRLPRWNLIVFSVVPSSAAICLFSLPATTKSKTWRSRAVSIARHFAMRSRSRRAGRSTRSLASAAWMAAISAASSIGLVRKSAAPCFIA